MTWTPYNTGAILVVGGSITRPIYVKNVKTPIFRPFWAGPWTIFILLYICTHMISWKNNSTAFSRYHIHPHKPICDTAIIQRRMEPFLPITGVVWNRNQEKWLFCRDMSSSSKNPRELAKGTSKLFPVDVGISLAFLNLGASNIISWKLLIISMVKVNI